MEQDLPKLSDLFPGMNEAELLEAEANLERYLRLVLRIYERLEAGPSPLLTRPEGTLT